MSKVLVEKGPNLFLFFIFLGVWLLTLVTIKVHFFDSGTIDLL